MTDTEKATLEARIDELCAENEKLRQLADGAANEADRLTHDAAAFQIENAKLRELCKTLYQLADESYVPFGSVNRWMDDFKKAICAMRELGIGVDE